MMSEKKGKRYAPLFKYQLIMEFLSGTKAIGQIARSYGVHPVTLTHWKKEFIEKWPH
jgi:transposase